MTQEELSFAYELFCSYSTSKFFELHRKPCVKQLREMKFFFNDQGTLKNLNYKTQQHKMFKVNATSKLEILKNLKL
ncbi:hypothetical protein BpHYR1_041243 [Brachionus plicatilis]|uniref:Uncharacterized protein n=1 Tax=Brachionus plicatilis TaxID=10195 RepID=A0A3M7Q8Z0_BRAPC|nr:hypothetical protein BpHYR1_041243 [Brachionus plicatilis]